jgi:hypothetical protein
MAIVLAVGPVKAGTIVLANRTADPVAFTVVHSGKPAEKVQLESADVISVEAVAPTAVRFQRAGTNVEYALRLDTAYFFYPSAEPNKRGIDLQQIGLAGATEEPAAQDASEPLADKADGSPGAALLKISVKLMVDDEERAAERAWQQRLVKRLAEASRILQRQARVTFEAVSFGTWDSDDDNSDFPTALREFEAETPPRPARLAIGFTSQYAIVQGRTNLGGTRGALQPHILIREWSQHFTEPERLELLVHELGHFLAAAHSPESDSVMRPILGDRQARAQRFRITFDPLNALAMSLTAEGLRAANVERLSQLSAPTRRRLGEVYLTLSRSMPADPAARYYLHWVAGGALPLLPGPTLHRDEETREPVPGEPPEGILAEVEGTRRVLAAIVKAARHNAALPLEEGPKSRATRLVGDSLTERYVRAAVEETLRERESTSNQAMLLALAVACDTGDLMRANPLTANLWRQVETDDERGERLSLIGLPTMHQRADLAQHFFVSAALTSLAGPTAAEAAGLAKELRDMQGASGFSFADLCADLAGIAFAWRLGQDQRQLNGLLQFRVADQIPSLGGLDEGLAANRFAEQYGSVLDPRFQKQVRLIHERIEALENHRPQPQQ